MQVWTYLDIINREIEHILIATTGLPRSGKSSWAQCQMVPVVQPDSIRRAVHGLEFFGPAEPVVWTTALIMVRSLFLAGHPVIILDSTMATEARRDEWLTKDWVTAFRLFDTLPAECKRRAEAAGDSAGKLAAIDRMAQQWETLGVDKVRYEGDLPV
jgi:predicted kinase